MSIDAETLELLERAVNQMDAIVAGVRADQETQPTPCADWDVQALLGHVVGHSMPNFIVAASGRTPDWHAPAAAVDADWADAYTAAAGELLSRWRAADMERMVVSGSGEAPLRSRADQQIAELAVHAWDLARATGQDGPLDAAVAEHAQGWSRPLLKPQYRGAGQGFGPEVPVPPGAPIYDKLVGWFGRNPQWQPGGNQPG